MQFISHSNPLKGKQLDNHKYYKRIDTGKKGSHGQTVYRYFYSKEEFDAHNGSDTKNGLSKITATLSKVTSTTKSKISDLKGSVIQNGEKFIDTAKHATIRLSDKNTRTATGRLVTEQRYLRLANMKVFKSASARDTDKMVEDRNEKQDSNKKIAQIKETSRDEARKIKEEKEEQKIKNELAARSSKKKVSEYNEKKKRENAKIKAEEKRAAMKEETEMTEEASQARKYQAEENKKAKKASSEIRDDINKYNIDADINLAHDEQISDYLPKKNKETTAEEDMASINPNYDPNNELYSQNCALCTLAYDVRRRGYDVTAIADSEGRTKADWALWYDIEPSDIVSEEDVTRNTNSENNSRSRAFIDSLKQNGTNTRGSLSITWYNGSGHSMVWEVDKNGKVLVRDCQRNKVYTEENISEFMNFSVTYTYIRLDDKNIKTRAIKELASNNVLSNTNIKRSEQTTKYNNEASDLSTRKNRSNKEDDEATKFIADYMMEQARHMM